MTNALWLLVFQGVLGAFDTFYYHEWRARLPALGRSVRSELWLHAARTFIYAILYATLPIIVWDGAWSIVLGFLFVIEIVITLTDFRVEVDVRKPLGGLYHGERSMHAVIGIAYGAMVGYLAPVLLDWWAHPTNFQILPLRTSQPLKAILFCMAAGALLSALRDAYAAIGGPYSHWPWLKKMDGS